MRRVVSAVVVVAALAVAGCSSGKLGQPDEPDEPDNPRDVLEQLLDGLGFEATIDDPAPARTAVPVDPDRLVIAIGAVRAAAAAELEAGDPNAILDQIPAGTTYVLVEVTASNPSEGIVGFGYSFWPLFGDEQRSIYNASCGSLATDLRQAVRDIPPGDTVTGEVCLLAPETEVATMRVGVEAGLTGRMVVFEQA